MGCVVNARLRPLYSRERPGTHCMGGWMDSRAGLDGCGKSRQPPGFDSINKRQIIYIFAHFAIYGFLALS